MSARTNLKKALLLFSVALLIGISTYFKHFSTLITGPKWNPPNYLRPIEGLHRDLLVNTSKCQIPDINIWNPQVRALVGPFTKASCENNEKTSRFGGLTFVKKQVVVINETVLKSNGLQLTDLECCYQTIARVVQSKTSYNRDADKKIEYSENCYPMRDRETAPHSGFIKVSCELKGYLGKLNYSAFHLLATFHSELESGTGDLSRKLEYWRNNRDLSRPPNVLLIGIDSTSRLNFRRSMPLTTNILETTFGAVEMKGYTKVGDNTFPNFVPVMTSLSAEELADLCYPGDWTALDECPFLWKNFSGQNYLTGHIEDCPNLQMFSHEKTGFVEQPTDIYTRPWMLAAYGDVEFVHCIGSQRPDQVVLQYAVDLVELAESHGLPYFIIVFITELTHDTKNDLHNMDGPLGNALLRLHERDFSKNSVLIVMSDHGYRYFPVRRSLSGWYEDKLPALWISLPNKIRKQNPSWMDALQQNSGQLTSPFELHQALKDILNLGRTSDNTWERKGTYTLFERIPDRTCAEAWIPIQYCACAAPQEFGDMEIVKHAVNETFQEIRGVELKLGGITAFAQLTNSGTNDNSTLHLIVGFNAAPSTAVEAIVSYNYKLKSFEVLYWVRTSKT